MSGAAPLPPPQCVRAPSTPLALCPLQGPSFYEVMWAMPGMSQLLLAGDDLLSPTARAVKLWFPSGLPAAYVPRACAHVCVCTQAVLMSVCGECVCARKRCT